MTAASPCPDCRGGASPSGVHRRMDDRPRRVAQSAHVQRPHSFPLDDAGRLTALAARGLLAATLLAGLIGLLAHGPIEIVGGALRQADTRAFGPLPNAVNVLSHLPLLLVAVLACRACLALTRRSPRRATLWARGWTLFFGCVALGALVGAAFHAQPSVARQLLVEAAIGSASAVLALLFLAEHMSFGLLRGHWLLLAGATGPAAALAAAASGDVRLLVASRIPADRAGAARRLAPAEPRHAWPRLDRRLRDLRWRACRGLGRPAVVASEPGRHRRPGAESPDARAVRGLAGTLCAGDCAASNGGSQLRRGHGQPGLDLAHHLG